MSNFVIPEHLPLYSEIKDTLYADVLRNTENSYGGRERLNSQSRQAISNVVHSWVDKPIDFLNKVMSFHLYTKGSSGSPFTRSNYPCRVGSDGFSSLVFYFSPEFAERLAVYFFCGDSRITRERVSDLSGFLIDGIQSRETLFLDGILLRSSLPDTSYFPICLQSKNNVRTILALRAEKKFNISKTEVSHLGTNRILVQLVEKCLYGKFVGKYKIKYNRHVYNFKLDCDGIDIQVGRKEFSLDENFFNALFKLSLVM